MFPMQKLNPVIFHAPQKLKQTVPKHLFTNMFFLFEEVISVDIVYGKG